jgi:hypothetical protein
VGLDAKGASLREVVAGVAMGLAAVAGGSAVELAPIYLLLASTDASYSSGQVYGATGGRGGP